MVFVKNKGRKATSSSTFFFMQRGCRQSVGVHKEKIVVKPDKLISFTAKAITTFVQFNQPYQHDLNKYVRPSDNAADLLFYSISLIVAYLK